eukprot:2106348-Ditylum_brightwellii.AAC.1
MALIPPIRESAVELSTTNMMGLEHVGVETEDLYNAANGNCATAMKVDQLTIGRDQGETMDNRAEDVESGLCFMHLGHLALGLALSFTKCTTTGVQINYWVLFCNLYKKMKVMLSFLFDRKHKSHFKDYKKALWSIHAIRVSY